MAEMFTTMAQLCDPDKAGLAIRMSYISGALDDTIKQYLQVQPPLLATSFSTIGIKPVPDASNTQIRLQSNQIVFDLTFTLSFHAMTTDASGNPVDKGHIQDRVIAINNIVLALFPTVAGGVVEAFHFATVAPFPKETPTTPGPPDPIGLAAAGLTQKQYESAADAIMANGVSRATADQVVQGLVMPDLTKYLLKIKIAQPVDYVLSTDHIIVRGIAYLADIGCPMVNVPDVWPEIKIHHEEQLRDGAEPRRGDSRLVVSTELAAPGPSAARPACRTTQPESTVIFAVYYPFKISAQKLLDQPIGPSVSAADTGQFLFLRWQYGISATPKNVTLAPDAASCDLVSNGDLVISGSAAVAVQIGCVYLPLVGAAVHGYGDFELRSSLDVTLQGSPRSRLKAGFKSALTKVRLYIGFTGLPYLDLLLDVLMGSIGDRLISERLTKLAFDLRYDLVLTGGLFGSQPAAPFIIVNTQGMLLGVCAIQGTTLK